MFTQISVQTQLPGLGRMAHFYVRFGSITNSLARTQAQLDKQVEHAVDREEHLRRDREIQRALERMASKDELRNVKIRCSRSGS